MMKAYFDRNLYLYISREPTFDGIPVEVDEQVVTAVTHMRRLEESIEQMIDESAAPEESNQAICDEFANGVKLLFKTRKQDNTRGN
jgi:hypothetical protein